MAVKILLESRLESVFHSSSFGYRPGRNAHQAVNQARRNCWPRVSNDNAFSESLFRTLKYCPSWPSGGFATLRRGTRLGQRICALV